MDPNATLRAIFAATTKEDATELCQALEAWLKRGGFAPRVPEGAKYWPGTNTLYSILSPEFDTEGQWMFVRYNARGDLMFSCVLPGEVL